MADNEIFTKLLSTVFVSTFSIFDRDLFYYIHHLYVGGISVTTAKALNDKSTSPLLEIAETFQNTLFHEKNIPANTDDGKINLLFNAFRSRRFFIRVFNSLSDFYLLLICWSLSVKSGAYLPLGDHF